MRASRQTGNSWIGRPWRLGFRRRVSLADFIDGGRGGPVSITCSRPMPGESSIGGGQSLAHGPKQPFVRPIGCREGRATVPAVAIVLPWMVWCRRV